MSEDSSSDERLRRLEAAGEAVQVVTMHGVKGLEFDFVYCPYLWSVNKDAGVNDRLLVRRDDGWVLADGAQRDNGADQRASAVERLLEDSAPDLRGPHPSPPPRDAARRAPGLHREVHPAPDITRLAPANC